LILPGKSSWSVGQFCSPALETIAVVSSPESADLGHLSAQIERARRLAYATMDREARQALLLLAAELEQQADKLRSEQAVATGAQRSAPDQES
jgi:hypothetical protein